MSPEAKHRTLLAGISHQIGQPLTVLRGTLEMALLREADSGLDRAAIEDAMRETDRLVSLAGLLRELAAVETLHQVEASVGLCVPVEGVLQDMAPLAETRGIRMDSRLSGDPVVRGDEHHLRQIVLSLVDCCLRFTAEGASLFLSVEEKDGEARLDIQMSDTELTPERLEEMFRPFADGAKQAPGGDGGLGMAICHRAVEILGGNIAVDSENGKVRCIRLCFPASSG